jgi:ABC-2 type transport system ATP-binding protein
VVAELDVPWNGAAAPSGTSIEAVEADAHRVTFALHSATAGELIASLAASGALRDVSVLEPDIEDVVARLYAAPEPSRG